MRRKSASERGGVGFGEAHLQYTIWNRLLMVFSLPPPNSQDGHVRMISKDQIGGEGEDAFYAIFSNASTH